MTRNIRRSTELLSESQRRLVIDYHANYSRAGDVSVGTLRHWARGDRKPCGVARETQVMLVTNSQYTTHPREVVQEPQAVLRALT